MLRQQTVRLRISTTKKAPKQFVFPNWRGVIFALSKTKQNYSCTYFFSFVFSGIKYLHFVEDKMMCQRLLQGHLQLLPPPPQIPPLACDLLIQHNSS